MSDRELEDLQNLVKHPGWQRFGQYIGAELANMVGPQLDKVADDPDDAKAASKLRQMVAAKKTVERLCKWPYERIQKLEQKASTPEPSMSRGGV